MGKTGGFKKFFALAFLLVFGMINSAFGQTELKEGRNDITSSGLLGVTRTLPWPAQVEIYALGGGGGGQGGIEWKTKGSWTWNRSGDGGAGGGGAAAYMRYNETASNVTFQIRVASGGSGGGGNKDGELFDCAGWRGSNGGNTIVQRNGSIFILTARGGGGGGRERLAENNHRDTLCRDVRGGLGGTASIQVRPHNSIFEPFSGSPGQAGRCDGDGCKRPQTAGASGRVPGGTGSMSEHFGGESGGRRTNANSCDNAREAPGLGGGGVGLYKENTGQAGGRGHVVIWVTRLWRITFDSNGGNAVASIGEILDGTSVESQVGRFLPTPIRDGYKFDGWFTSGGALFSGSSTVSANITLTARWKAIHTITFNRNDEAQTIHLTRNVVNGDPVGELPLGLIRPGYTFNNRWRTAQGTEWSASTIVTANTTLYAEWSPPIKYNVFYHNLFDAIHSNPATFDVTQSVTLSPPTQREHVTFGGWFDNDRFAGGAINTIQKGSVNDKRFWARWDSIPRTVTFDSRGGSVVSSAIVNSGNRVREPSAPTKYEYILSHWSTDIAGNTVWSFADSIVNRNITLYAQWRSIYEGDAIRFPDITREYNGQAHKIESIEYFSLSIGLDWITLYEDENFTVQYHNSNVNAGFVNVTITGIGERVSINYIADPNARKSQFQILPKPVNVIWGETNFVWNGEIQTPTATVDWGDYELTVRAIMGEQSNVGTYAAIANLTQDNSNIRLLSNNISTPYSIAQRPVEVRWEDTGPFTYNRMVQAPTAVASIDFGGGRIETLDLNVGNSHSAAGNYTGQQAARAVITNSAHNLSVLGNTNNIILTNDTQDYEILRAPLRVRLRTADENAIELNGVDFVSDGELSAAQIEQRLTELIEFQGFARDTITNISDNESVLSGSPRVRITEIDGPQNAPSVFSRSNSARSAGDSAVTLSIRDFLVAIDASEVSADNYIPVPQEDVSLTIRTLILANTAQIKIGDYLQPLPKIGDFLQAIVPGEGIEQAGTLNYEWEVGGVTVPDNNSDIFEVREDDIGKTIRVIITGSNTIGRAISDFLQPVSETSITQKPQDMGSALFKKNPVRTHLKINLPDGERLLNFTVLDALGNLVHNSEFGSSTASTGSAISLTAAAWDLRNSAGRFVANGLYLVIVEAMDKNGKTKRYSGKVGVKR